MLYQLAPFLSTLPKSEGVKTLTVVLHRSNHAMLRHRDRELRSAPSIFPCTFNYDGLRCAGKSTSTSMGDETTVLEMLGFCGLPQLQAELMELYNKPVRKHHHHTFQARHIIHL